MHTKEQRLAAALKKGDTAALAKIIDSYAGYVCAVIRNFSRGTFTEEDIDELELADDLSVEYKAELGELMRELDGLIKSLPDEDREIFMRFYFYGQKSSEIALITDMAEGTVRSRLSRTRAKLREELRNRGFDYEEIF